MSSVGLSEEDLMLLDGWCGVSSMRGVARGVVMEVEEVEVSCYMYLSSL